MNLATYFLPDVLTEEETGILIREAHQIFDSTRSEVVREKDEKTARTAFAAHQYNEAYRRLGRHPRLIEPVMQLLGGAVYMHPHKINAKAAFNGDVWQWHQDYGTWARDNLMPEPRWIAHRDFAPMVPLPDNCLREWAQVAA